MTDSNQEMNKIDTCAAWDHDSYSAGVHVGPEFGCIHFDKKDKAP